MALSWKRLVRFRSTDGRVLRGEPVVRDDLQDLGSITAADEVEVRILSEGDIYDTTGKTRLLEETAIVERVLAPLAAAEVPILRCVGLNYATHSKSQPGRHAPI
jgi:hypothetical protein